MALIGGLLLIVTGLAVIAARRFSGQLGARVQNAALDTDRVRPAWIEGWNLILGIGLVTGGVVWMVVYWGR